MLVINSRILNHCFWKCRPPFFNFLLIIRHKSADPTFHVWYTRIYTLFIHCLCQGEYNNTLMFGTKIDNCNVCICIKRHPCRIYELKVSLTSRYITDSKTRSLMMILDRTAFNTTNFKWNQVTHIHVFCAWREAHYKLLGSLNGKRSGTMLISLYVVHAGGNLGSRLFIPFLFFSCLEVPILQEPQPPYGCVLGCRGVERLGWKTRPTFCSQTPSIPPRYHARASSKWPNKRRIRA